MKRTAKKTSVAAALIGGAAALFLQAAPAFPLDAATEKGLIGTALHAGYSQGYAARDAAPILALYDPQAEIVTFTAGRLGKAAFGTMLGGIFKGWTAADAKVEIEEASFPGKNEALVTFHLQVSGTSDVGKPMVRQDRWHALLRRDGKGWLILKQGYRADFSVAESAHDDKGRESAPAAPSSHGGWH